VNKKGITSGNTETIKQEIKKLIEKYNRVAEEKRINQYNEEMTKKDFILPLFHALGWNTEDSSEVSAEEKISKKRADYSFRINGIPKFFLEAKPIKADLNKPEYTEQAINYAWHKGCPWAVLTDFENIKIYNAEWKSENPIQQNLLKDIPCSSFIERFDELFLLSKEGFEKGLLDKEAEKWGKRTKKISVDKQLLTDFTRFRELLSKNITKLNQSKNITEEDLDEAVQRILDRLIFIRNCEDRELEARTLISGYREWESRGRGQLIKSLRNIFIDFDKKYNSKIFANHLCDSLDIDNEVLHEIIEGLYYTKDKSVSYDFSAIEADVLGTIYEQYLGNILRKSDKRAKLTENHAHRKEQGIYYTPTYIVDFIVKNTLGELLKDKKVNVEKIRILDPACGSGSFLIKAFDVLNEYWMGKDKTYDQLHLDYTGTGEFYSKKIGILQNNIFGVDLDKQAVEITQLNLLLRITEKGQRLPLLQQNIKCGNSLIDDPLIAGDKAFKWEEEFKQIIDEGSFDVVIGNPPYVNIHSLSKEDIDFYRFKYFSADYQFDLFALFIEKAISLLREGGKFGFIVPALVLRGYQYTKIRKHMFDQTKIDIIYELGDNVFEGVQMPTCILILEKCSNFKSKTNSRFSYVIRTQKELSQFRQTERKQSDLKETDDYIIEGLTGPASKEILMKMESGLPLEVIAKVNRGLELSKKHEGISDEQKEKEDLPILSGEEIARYVIKKTKFIRRQLYNKFSKDSEFFENEKLLIRETGARLTAVYDNRSMINLRSLYNIRTKDKMPLKYILALLNSKLFQYYYSMKFKASTDIFPKIRIAQVKKMPIKSDKKYEATLITLVDKMLSLNKRLNEIGDKKTDERADIEEEIKHTDNEIDELVYKIYGITDEEKKIIEESLK
jgi:type I restriction-modification system DNA methylase subunit